MDFQRHDRVKFISGPYSGKSGYVTRVSGGTACVVIKGVCFFGIWFDVSDLKRTKRYKIRAVNT